MDVEYLSALLAGGMRPAFIFAMCDGHNPLGVSMSREKRERLVGLAREYRIPVIEDDVYGFLYHGDKSLPPLRALEAEWVFYLGSFSKILGPGLRAGWMIVPESLTSALSFLKDACDIDSCSIIQKAIAAYLDAGHLAPQLNTVRRRLRDRCGLMLDALKKYLPVVVRWSEPTSGIFIWVELPEEIDTSKLFTLAIEREQVAFVPGAVFSPHEYPRASNCLRLNFTNGPREHIVEGIKRLSRVL
jgi:2-aminoadipate transaminase